MDDDEVYKILAKDRRSDYEIKQLADYHSNYELKEEGDGDIANDIAAAASSDRRLETAIETSLVFKSGDPRATKEAFEDVYHLVDWDNSKDIG